MANMASDDLTTTQAADLLGITRAAVILAIARGTLRAKGRWGNAFVLSRADVLAYRAARRVGRPPGKAKRK